MLPIRQLPIRQGQRFNQLTWLAPRAGLASSPANPGIRTQEYQHNVLLLVFDQAEDNDNHHANSPLNEDTTGNRRHGGQSPLERARYRDGLAVRTSRVQQQARPAKYSVDIGREIVLESAEGSQGLVRPGFR